MVDLSRRRLLCGPLSILAAGLAPYRPAASAEAPAALPAPPGPAASPAFTLEAMPSPSMSPPAAAPSLGFSGEVPKILRVAKGTTSTIRLVNRLTEATDIDWHGMRLPNALDLVAGLGSVPVAAGATRDIAVPAPDAGTFWFHPRFTPGLSDQTARGLAGVLIVEEPDAPAADADTVLLLTDRAADGAALSDRLAVNGQPWPQTHTHPPGARLRLRLVNGSTREAVAVTFAGAQPFVIAIDGQPSELFRPLNDTLPVGPGARFDIMVDLGRRAGAEFKLVLQGSSGPSPVSDRPVYVARTEGAPAAERPPIRSLTPNASLPRYIPLEHSVRAQVVAASRRSGQPGDAPLWTFNGNDGRILSKKPLFTAKSGAPVTLALVNRSPGLTAFRLHGHVMRLLHAKDDGWEPYWRDSVIVPSGGTSHVAFLAGPPGRWLIESPFFAHSTRGMRGWFEIT